MDKAANREARTGSVGNRGPAAIGVPAKDLAGKLKAAHSVGACGKLHAAHWHMEDVCSAGCIEHVQSIEEVRERLAIFAVAHETKTGVRRNTGRNSAHMAALAAKLEIVGARVIKRHSYVSLGSTGDLPRPIQHFRFAPEAGLFDHLVGEHE